MEREHLAEQAREAEVAAAVARSRSSFLSAVGHNFKTPLAAVKVSANTLRTAEDALTPEERRALLANIEEETDRLERLIGRVLAVSRMRAGELQPQRMPVDLAGLVGTTMRRLAPLLGDRRFGLEVAPDLPVVHLDVLMAEQVLLNLLENALRYAPPGSEVRVAARRTAGRLELRVSDSGPGVLPEHRDRVFDEFFQAAPRRDGVGTGLGLHIVRGLVEAHGGRVWCEETPGGGATFVLRVPVGSS